MGGSAHPVVVGGRNRPALEHSAPDARKFGRDCLPPAVPVALLKSRFELFKSCPDPTRGIRHPNVEDIVELDSFAFQELILKRSGRFNTDFLVVSSRTRGTYKSQILFRCSDNSSTRQQ